MAGGANTYGFVGGDPVNYSDPLGLCVPMPWCLLALAGGGAATDLAGGAAVEGLVLGGPPGWLAAGGLILASRLDAMAGGGGPTAMPDAAPADGVAMFSRRSGRSLKREWEELNGRAWPEGCVAHHICPLADGGPDTGANVEPKTPERHVQDHKGNGDFKRWGARRKPGEPDSEPPPSESKAPSLQ